MIVIDEYIFKECIHRIDKLAGYVSREIKRHQVKMNDLNQKIQLTRWEMLSSIKTEEDNDKTANTRHSPEKTG